MAENRTQTTTRKVRLVAFLRTDVSSMQYGLLFVAALHLVKKGFQFRVFFRREENPVEEQLSFRNHLHAIKLAHINVFCRSPKAGALSLRNALQGKPGGKFRSEEH